MKPIQIALRREFKKLNEKLDDVLMDITVKKLEEVIDYEMSKFYKDVHNIIEQSKYEINKIDTLEDARNSNLDKLIEELYKIKIDNYIENIRTISRDNVFSETKPIIDEMKLLVSKAACISDMKQSNILHYSTWNAIHKITDILNLVADEYNTSYIEMVNTEIIELNKCIEKKRKYIFDDNNMHDEESVYIKRQFEKILDYKIMNKLAIEHGFKEVRQTGDHKIFSNGIDSIPIPQHDLGKGLSFKIQKQIDVCNKKLNKII